MDYPRWYETISRPLRGTHAPAVLAVGDKVLVAAFAAGYLALLAQLAASGDARLWRAIAVPAATFAIVTALRAAIDRQRPYEAFHIEPLIEKDTRGKSLPSRHVASAVAIACALGWVMPAFAAPLALACIAIALIRVVGGVHYPTDVLAAVALALACAFAGFL